MRPSRFPSVPFLLLALAACSKAPPPERFLGTDTDVAVVIPSLEGFAAQGSALLATAATFPGGQSLNDVRAVGTSRLGFDPLDAESMAKAGLDRKRGAAIGVVIQPGAPAATVAALPAADAKKLAATLESLAKEKLQFEVRSVEKGSPEIVLWAPTEGAPTLLAYAFSEKTAIVAFGAGAQKFVEGALKVPKGDHLGTKPEYKAAIEAAGGGQAAVFYVAPDALPLQTPEFAQVAELFKKGLAVGLSGAKDRFAFTVGMPLDDDSPFLKAAKTDAGPLVARLDPNAAWVARSDADAGTTTSMQKEMLRGMLAKMSVSETVEKAVVDAFESFGGGAAMGIGVVPSNAGARALKDAALSFFRIEYLIGLKDPAKMKEALKSLAAELGEGKVQGGEQGPWIFAAAGGEVGVAVEDKQLVLAAGPTGSLAALQARSGTTFKPPTATAAKAFSGSMGGMYIDVPKIAAGLKVIPASSFGDDPAGTMGYANLQKVTQVLSRFTALSVFGDLKDKRYHGELVLEIAPPPAK